MNEIMFTLPPEALEALAVRVADILEERQNTTATTTVSRWMTVSEAADYLRCSKQRIYDARSAGRLSRHADGSRALIDRNELDNLIEGGAR